MICLLAVRVPGAALAVVRGPWDSVFFYERQGLIHHKNQRQVVKLGMWGTQWWEVSFGALRFVLGALSPHFMVSFLGPDNDWMICFLAVRNLGRRFSQRRARRCMRPLDRRHGPRNIDRA